ncbi:MAG: TRAM domain-containing protein [Candidatus Woesearchaeota archaeon]
MRNRNYGSDNYEPEGNRERRFGGRGNFGGQRPSPPVSEGEELEVTIEAIAAKGDGLAKKNGFVIFVPGTKEGQRVKVRITRVLRRLAFAEVVGASAAPEAPKQEAHQEEEQESFEEGESDSSEDFESSEDSEDF